MPDDDSVSWASTEPPSRSLRSPVKPSARLAIHPPKFAVLEYVARSWEPGARNSRCVSMDCIQFPVFVIWNPPVHCSRPIRCFTTKPTDAGTNWNDPPACCKLSGTTEPNWNTPALPLIDDFAARARPAGLNHVAEPSSTRAR